MENNHLYSFSLITGVEFCISKSRKNFVYRTGLNARAVQHLQVGGQVISYI